MKLPTSVWVIPVPTINMYDQIFPQPMAYYDVYFVPFYGQECVWLHCPYLAWHIYPMMLCNLLSFVHYRMYNLQLQSNDSSMVSCLFMTESMSSIVSLFDGAVHILEQTDVLVCARMTLCVRRLVH